MDRKAAVEQQVWYQVYDRIGNLVRSHVDKQVWQRVYYQSEATVHSYVTTQVSNKVRVQAKVRGWYRVWDQASEDTDESKRRG